MLLKSGRVQSYAQSRVKPFRSAVLAPANEAESRMSDGGKTWMSNIKLVHRRGRSTSVSREVRSSMMRTAVLVCGLGVSGCASIGGSIAELNDSVLRPERVHGVYHLVALQNSPLPFQSRAGSGTQCPRGGELTTTEVHEGRLILDSRSVEILANAILHCRTPEGSLQLDTMPQRLLGSYFLDDTTLRINTADGQLMRLSYNETSGEIRSNDLAAVWKRHSEVAPANEGAVAPTQPSPPSGTIEHEQSAAADVGLLPRITGGQPVYDCRRDPILDAAATIPPADTAGLGSRIASAYPHHHLSTEREIACRFSEADWTAPHSYMPEMGSGRAWWVHRADITRDGRPDIVTILTAIDDPAKDLVVAFFADGNHAAIGSTGGGGFGVSEQAEEVWIYLVVWEKGADRFRWNGQTFEGM